MNLRFLGDALDHWKGSLFEILQSTGVLRNFAVDPMASDLENWTNDDFGLFARLLRIHTSQIITHHCSLNDRTAYFAEILHKGDLFLDADTGIATGRVKRSCCYVYPTEVLSLLSQNNGRVVAFYQHVRAVPVIQRTDRVVQALRLAIPDAFSSCTYESGNVAMLFVSRSEARVLQLTSALTNLLGRHASKRIRLFSPEH